MVIITSGSKYIDIDAYASCIAYREFLKLKGIQAKAITTAKPNESITESLLQLNLKLDTYESKKEDQYIIIDVSNKEYFDKMVQEEKVIEVIDHHVGFEEYWKKKLGEKADIQFIGSVATIIVERYEKENLINQMCKDVAYLLMAAILDNTLNFKAKITTSRDKEAYQKLQEIVGEKIQYNKKYFLECQREIQRDLVKAIENDTKLEKVNEIIPYIFGQLTVWDKGYLFENKKVIYDTLNQLGDQWMMNLICLQDGKSYILSNHPEVQKKLEELMNHKFKDNVMILPEVWLRKEIIKRSWEMKL